MPSNSFDHLISQIESILFVSGEPVEINLIQETLKLDSDQLSEIIIGLYQKYSKPDSGLEVSVTGNTLQLISKAENYQVVLDTLKTEKKRPLSRAAYEVLAIIAYNQPVTRAELEQIRGVNSVSALQHLLDLGLVEECGRKDVIGNPFLFQTTEYFLQMAKINNLEELPEFENFKEKLK